MTQSDGPPYAGIVRILRAGSDEPCGMGFLTDTDAGPALLTCAHVVCDALGLRADHPDPPGEALTVDFVLLPGRPRLTARVEAGGWRPVTDGQPGDMALLRPVAAVPGGAGALPLRAPERLWDRQVRCFGTPPRYDDGVWVGGRLLAQQGTGLVLVESDRGTGFSIEKGFSGGPVWDERSRGVLGMVSAVAEPSRRTGFLIPADTLLRAWPQLGRAAAPANPYRGLRPFREQDAALFHGRAALAESIAAKVRGQRVVSLVGPSGHGKSSLIFAGVVPLLRQDGDLEIVSMRPGGNAIRELSGVLLDALEPELSEAQRLADRPLIEETIRGGRLTEVVDRVLRKTGRSELLVIVDQLEEAVEQDGGATGALAMLVDAALDEPRPRLRVLSAVRSDFVDRALSQPELARGLQSLEGVGVMTRDQLMAAVIGPLPEGVRFSDQLAARIVDDVRYAPGQLPLLQFVLDRLWSAQAATGVLTHAKYAELGGVGGALARYAEQEAWQSLPEADRRTSRSLFIRLVRVEADLPPTRRSTARMDLSAGEWELAQRLIAKGLLVGGRGGTVELAHEALIGSWDRLRQWVDDDHEFQIWRATLRDELARIGRGPKAPLWQLFRVDEQRRSGKLLASLALPEARRWRDERGPSLTPEERGFVDELISTAQRRRNRWALLAAPVALVLFMVGGVVYMEKTSGSSSTDPVANYVYGLPDDVMRQATLLDLVAAYQTDPNSPARGKLFDAYVSTLDIDDLFTDPRPNVSIYQAVADAGGDTMVTRSNAGATLWRPANGHMVATSLNVASPGNVAVAPDGGLIAVDDRREVHLFDRSGHPLGTVTVPVNHDTGETFPVAMAVTDDRIATWFQHDDQIFVLRRDGTVARRLPIGDVASVSMWFHADGRDLVTFAGGTGEVRDWDAATGASRTIVSGAQAAVGGPSGDVVTCREGGEGGVELETFPASGTPARFTAGGVDTCDGIAMDPSGGYLLAPRDNRERDDDYIVDLRQHRVVAEADGPGDSPPTVLSESQGRLRLAFHDEGSVAVLDADVNSLENITYDLGAGALSRDGHDAVTAVDAEQPWIELWVDQRATRYAWMPARVRALQIDPTNRYIMVTLDDRPDIFLYRVSGLQPVRTIALPRDQGVPPPIAAFDGDGHVLTSYAGQLTTWDIESGRRLDVLPLPMPVEGAQAVPFAPMAGGTRVATVGSDRRSLDIWDRRSHRKVGQWGAEGDPIVAVLAPPRPDRLVVARSAGSDVSLESWYIGEGRSTVATLGDANIILHPGMSPDMISDAVRSAVDLRPDRVVAGSEDIHEWNYQGRPLDGDDGDIENYEGQTLDLMAGRILSSGPAYVASLNESDWIRHVCDVVGRADLTAAEREGLPAQMRSAPVCR